MTLKELSQSFNLQGNIEIKVFDPEGNEKETRCFKNEDTFCCTCTDTNDLEDLEVTYMYAIKSADGEAWMVIEVSEAEE